MRKPKRAALGYFWGLLLFGAISLALTLGLSPEFRASAVRAALTLESTLLVVALVGWKLASRGRPFSEMGWRRAAWWNHSYPPWFGVAAATMAAGSAAMTFMQPAPEMHFYEAVLVGWLLGSFAEEVYVRGLVQSWMTGPDDGSAGNSVFTPTIVWSALLGGALHWPWLAPPASMIKTLIIVFGMLGVSWGCAVLRARTQSLLPAIACHIVSNIAIVPGAFLGVILYRLINGQLPYAAH